MSTLFSHFLSKNNEIRPQEANFTEVLCDIALVPKMLYFYGKMPQNRPKTVAIVGTRKPSDYGKKIAYDLAFAAAERGAIVVSGLAYGIDSIAHRGALAAGGITVAVLGTAIDDIYPSGHTGLAEEIVQKSGVVVSEVPPGTKFDFRRECQLCFLRRNRLISGLADVVVIVEAAERSGSLNTAAHALEQGREIFAVPGDVLRPSSMGCNKLLAKSGAQVYTGVDDVLDSLFPRAKKRRKKQAQAVIMGDSEAETAILRALCAGMTEGDEILRSSGLSVSDLNCGLTMLEVKGRIVAMGLNRWVLA